MASLTSESRGPLTMASRRLMLDKKVSFCSFGLGHGGGIQRKMGEGRKRKERADYSLGCCCCPEDKAGELCRSIQSPLGT